MKRREEYSFDDFDDYDAFDSFGASTRTTREVKSTRTFNPSVNLGTINYSKPTIKTGNNEWKIGMRVKHRRFGTGTIITVSGTGEKTMVTVAFENNGIKNLIAAQANLEIIGD